MSYDHKLTFSLSIGETLRGRWYGCTYQVIRALGKGANGQVYLVQQDGRKLAMKLALEPHGIALEYRLLKQLQRAAASKYSEDRGCRLGPFVYDLDDLVRNKNSTAFFYTMEYIEGIPAAAYIRDFGTERIKRVIVRLLEFLQQIHSMGYAFGDMKADNVLVNPVTGEVRLIDFGGLTRFGEGVRQYTEWYDRAYWGAGSRTADRHYDLFAVAMLITQLLGIKLEVQQRDLRELERHLHSYPQMRLWLPLIKDTWRGAYTSASHMQQEMFIINNAGRREKLIAMSFSKKINEELQRDWDWSDWSVLGSTVFCLFMVLRFLMVQ